MGRRKDSRNKATIAREQAMQGGTMPTQVTAETPKRRGRPPGSRNKATMEREQARVITGIEFDKYDNVFQNGERIGCIEYDDGVFIGKNERTQKQVVWPDYDDIVNWFKNNHTSQEAQA